MGREEAVPAESVSSHHSPEQPALIYVADLRSSRQNHALIGNTGNEPLPKATFIQGSTKVSTEELTEQHDQDRYGGQSPLLEDQSEEDPEMDPEMLLQPDPRPISHDQLVIEVKGIYAGLAMVEAKCIEIDETQLAAAQEEDPYKRTHLEADQWQSLIALHKQVHNIPSTYSPTTY